MVLCDFTEMKKWGYQSGVNLRAAPYDWRYSPRSSAKYLTKLSKLIEESYYANGKKKVVLMAHSQGGQFALYFLNKRLQSWKDKFINSLITLSTPWKGTVVGVVALSSGYSWNHDRLLDNLQVRKAQRTYETTALLLPSPDVWRDRPLAVTPNAVYTARNYSKFFKDISYPLGLELYKNVQSADYAFKHPGVALHCLYGSGVPTMEVLQYRLGSFPDVRPHIIYGDGDGTVNKRSLASCSLLGVQGHFSREAFEGVSHNGMLKERKVMEAIKKILI